MVTRAKALEIELVYGDLTDFPWDIADEFCGAIFQSPDNIGNMNDYSVLFTRFRERKVRSILVQDILSLPISKSAGEMGADMSCGSV